MTVLVADPVRWDIEFRCFCLDGRVRTLSPYLQSGVHAKHDGYEVSQVERDEATQLAESVLAAVGAATPRAVAVDVGQITGQGWAVVEANAAWGSGIYGCDPDSALSVIRHATGQSKQEG